MADEPLPPDWPRIVDEVARIVAQRRFPNSQLARDLCEQAPGCIWKKRNRYDPSRPFEPWVFSVLNNHATDMLREHNRRRKIDGITGWGSPSNDGNGQGTNANRRGVADPTKTAIDEQAQKATEVLEYILDAQTPFSERQMAIVLKLPVLRRIISLTIIGWWRRVPQEQWEKWLQELDIEPPFPSAQLNDLHELSERINYVAKHLVMNETAVRQHLYRSRDTLRQLASYE